MAVGKTPTPSDFFSRHAKDYAVSASHATGSDLDRLIELVDPQPTNIALDVATGTGFTAAALAQTAGCVVAVDITPEMLVEARKLLETNENGNLHYALANAADLPFRDAQFDIATSRRAPHHFGDIGEFLREVARVLKGGGRLGIVDMSPPEGARDVVNRIERLRDPTHARALSPHEWEHEVTRAGFEIQVTEVIAEAVTFEEWLYPVHMGGEEEIAVRQVLNESTAEGRASLNLRFEDEQVAGWEKTRVALLARNPK